MKKLFAISAACAALWTAPVQAGEPVVVELFTSQGCSACPRADKLLGEIAGEEDVIALSWAVDYWDYLGWKDTLAIPESAARQRRYAGQNASDMVFTPQVFIDGHQAYVGSRKKAIRKAIEEHRGDASTMVDIAMDRDMPGYVQINLSNSVPETADISVVFFDHMQEVSIGGGENKGRKGRYTNIVRGKKMLSLADAQGGTLNVDLSTKMSKNCDAFAVLIQDSATGKMLGAAVHGLKAKS